MDLSPSVVRIEPFAFAHCARLTSVGLGADSPLTAIENGAFQSSGITAFKLPAKVQVIKSHAFADCQSRFTFSIPVAESELEDIQAKAFLQSQLASITLPHRLRTIGDDAFKDCGSLKEAVFDYADHLVTIGAAAFSRCPLQRLRILTSSLMTIGAEAFAGCVNLQIIAIVGDPALQIGDGAFFHCRLAEIHLPARMGIERAFTESPTPEQFVTQLASNAGAFREAFTGGTEVTVEWM
jgi:hypothetical protein